MTMKDLLNDELGKKKLASKPSCFTLSKKEFSGILGTYVDDTTLLAGIYFLKKTAQLRKRSLITNQELETCFCLQ